MGFTLGDRLGLKTSTCRVRGCNRTWTDLSGSPMLRGGNGGANEASGDLRGLCEPCRKKYPSLADQQKPCAKPGCERTWTWTREEQLEAFANRRQGQGKVHDPKSLCVECEAELAALESKDVACAVPGCARTATLSPRDQFLGEGAVSPATAFGIEGVVCGPCADVASRLKDKDVGCGISQCKRTWVWGAAEQLSAFAQGKPNLAPRRMCTECRAEFGKLVEKPVRCRASGCKNTWTWTREDQLDTCVADKPLPKAPPRLCERCFDIWKDLQDVDRPCRQSGCTNTWIDKRGAQLARALRGKPGEPYPQYCAQHTQMLEHLGDRPVPCKTEGCDGTWTWTRAQQLAAGVRPPEMQTPEAPEVEKAAPGPVVVNDREPVAEDAAGAEAEHDPIVAGAEPDAGHDVESTELRAEPTQAAAVPGPAARPVQEKRGKNKRRGRRRREVHPPARHCARCADFLTTHKTIEIPCSACGTPIFWPPESQRQTDLGNWEVPKLCGACKRDATEAARQQARELLRQGGVMALVEHAGGPEKSPVPTEDAPASPETTGESSTH
jgi:hypothetical protein